MLNPILRSVWAQLLENQVKTNFPFRKIRNFLGVEKKNSPSFSLPRLLSVTFTSPNSISRATQRSSQVNSKPITSFQWARKATLRVPTDDRVLVWSDAPNQFVLGVKTLGFGLDAGIPVMEWEIFLKSSGFRRLGSKRRKPVLNIVLCKLQFN